MKRNIIYIWLLLALWLAKEARAQQVPGISYDKARSFRSERIFLEPDSSNVERYANRVAFLDGFGREYVAIDVQGSPIAGYDIVQPFHYGKDGRIDRELREAPRKPLRPRKLAAHRAGQRLRLLPYHIRRKAVRARHRTDEARKGMA